MSKKAAKKVTKKTAQKAGKKVTKKSAKKLNNKLESVFGGKNVAVIVTTSVELVRLQERLKRAGAKNIQKELKTNTEIIITDNSRFNIDKARKKEIDIYTTGEFDLLWEGRSIVKFPTAKDIPNSQNLSKLSAIKEGETIIGRPRLGVLKIKWKQVPFKVPRRFAELFGLMFIELENPYLGKVYFNNKELKPVKESDKGYDDLFEKDSEIFDYMDFAENGSDRMGGKVSGAGEFGFNCTAFMEKEWRGAKASVWNKKVYEYTRTNHRNEGGFGVVYAYYETGTLSVNLENKTWQYKHHVAACMYEGYGFVKGRDPG